MHPSLQHPRVEADVRERLKTLSLAYPELQWFYENTVRRLGGCTLSKVPYLAFAVITPDGLMQGVHSELIDQYGPYIVTYRIRRLNQSEAERLYFDGLVTTDSRRHIKSWWIKSKLFDLGESIGLLFHNPHEHDFQKALTERKGASDPLIALPGTFRHQYRTPNKVFALFHSSDDWFAMLYELSVYFNPDDLERFLNVKDPAIGEKLLRLRNYEPCWTLSRIETHRVLYRVKSRILLDLLAEPLLPDDITRDGLILLNHYENALTIIKNNPGFRAEGEELSTVIDQEITIVSRMASLAQQMGEEGLSMLVLCLAVLTFVENFREADYEGLEAMLRARGIPLTSFDKTVLESMMFFYEVL